MKNAFSRVGELASVMAIQPSELRSLDCRTALQDPRWPALATHLAGLRNTDRRSIRIIDVDCGAGCILLPALQHARNLGFTSVEGRGISGSSFLIKRARMAARLQQDPAIGVVFDVADMIDALQEERDLPADIILWHGAANGHRHKATLAALAVAGEIVIGDPVRAAPRCMA